MKHPLNIIRRHSCAGRNDGTIQSPATVLAKRGNNALVEAGFSLLELSIVVAIISLVVGMATSTGIGLIATSRLNATNQRMAAIDQALMSFRTAQDRIPCPASLVIKPTAANYGIEAANPGSCTGGTPAANLLRMPAIAVRLL